MLAWFRRLYAPAPISRGPIVYRSNGEAAEIRRVKKVVDERIELRRELYRMLREDELEKIPTELNVQSLFNGLLAGVKTTVSKGDRLMFLGTSDAKAAQPSEEKVAEFKQRAANCRAEARAFIQPRAMQPDGAKLAQMVRDQFEAITATVLMSTRQGRERSIAITKLQEACMWTVKGIANAYPLQSEMPAGSDDKAPATQ